MIQELKLLWKDLSDNNVRVMVVGNVQTVLNSSVSYLFPVPPVMYGFGALTSDGASNVGEGIVFRKRSGITPPVMDAGRIVSFHKSVNTISTPFFVGWKGDPTAEGIFVTDGNTTLKEIYEAILKRPEIKSACVMLELISLFELTGIHDRALIKPVDKGNVLITSPEFAGQYFKPEIILNDFRQRNEAVDGPFALAIVGTGYRQQGDSSKVSQFEQTIFYQPPVFGNGAQPSQTTGLKTHSHAMGWTGQKQLQDALLSLYQLASPQTGLERVEAALEELIEEKPTYIVHLDEWSRPLAGVIKVFEVDESKIEFIDSK